jgi:hypothetical protein
MFTHRNGPSLLITLGLVITAILTFTFSPAVRADVEAILTFNGVTVSVDETSGKLVVSGNMDAVVEQTDHSVTIKGENGEEAGAGIAAAQAVETANVNDLLTSHPDLILPTVPASYTLQPQVEVAGDSMTFTWKDSSGHLIFYQRTLESSMEEIPGSQEGSRNLAVNSDGLSTPVIQSGTGFISVSGEYNYSGPDILYNWVSGGYFHELTITNTALSEADLQAMLP